MAKLPYYMQNGSHENEEDEEDVKTDEKDEGVKAEGEGSVVVEEPVEGTGGEGQPELKTEKKKYKVGKVEVDPKIDYADFHRDGPNLESRAALTDEGMINIWVNLRNQVPDLPKDYARPVQEYAVDPVSALDCPPLNVVIFIVGSRGDVQPYLSLALRLVEKYNHTVRLATHPDFKDFILEVNKRLSGKTGKNGQSLEGHIQFFDVGGDPKQLMAYMVKNPGLLPGWASLTNGDIAAKRLMTSDMLQGFWQSTHEPDSVSSKPFAADAIISNPPAFAHVHIAEALGLPLLMSFTMPWSPTTDFKHPLVNIKKSNAEQRLTNYLSFAFADMLTWQGLGDVINKFRTGTLGIEAINARSGPSVLERLKIPWTYCWTEGLIPKPDDWKEHIDISGFYFLEGESDFKPDQPLVEFLAKGDAPIYIGFGSVVVEDPTAMTKMIFDAVKEAGVRALVSAGWGGLGGTDIPDDVFILEGSIPHDWLFAEGRVAACCHHGGAGTTAIGLRNGLPTIVVPFFGDQQFWGDMIHRASAGPAPIPHKQLTVENLSSALKFVMSEPAKVAAGKMGEKIRAESGEAKGVDSFHRHLPIKNMWCELDTGKVACWYSNDLCLRMSAVAAGVLASEKKIDLNKLEPLRPKEYPTRQMSMDPISGGAAAILGLVADHYHGIAQMFYNPAEGVVRTATSIPQGVADLLISVHEGFDSIPKHMGSQIRERGEVKDFQTGVAEAGKGLWWGWWDGITGLVTEPIAGGKKEGALGVIKGMGRSYVNVTARPAAGITGVLALPVQGLWTSLRKNIAGSPQKALRDPRRALSKSAAEECSRETRQAILKRFTELEKTTSERREKLKKKVEMFLKNGDVEVLQDGVDGKDYEKREKVVEGEGSGGEDKSGTEEEEMTEDEKRGYERAMREMKLKEAGGGAAEQKKGKLNKGKFW